jgi:hypothetical protein
MMSPNPFLPDHLSRLYDCGQHYKRLYDLCAFSAILPMAQMTDVSPVSENVAIFAKKFKEAKKFQP